MPVLCSQGSTLTPGDLDLYLQKMKPFSDCFAEGASLDCQESKVANLKELCFSNKGRETLEYII